jgi:hypothetical protein
MEAKYESLCGGWCSNAMHGSHRVGVLKNIRREERGFLQISEI